MAIVNSISYIKNSIYCINIAIFYLEITQRAHPAILLDVHRCRLKVKFIWQKLSNFAQRNTQKDTVFVHLGNYTCHVTRSFKICACKSS